MKNEKNVGAKVDNPSGSNRNSVKTDKMADWRTPHSIRHVIDGAVPLGAIKNSILQLLVSAGFIAPKASLPPRIAPP